MVRFRVALVGVQYVKINCGKFIYLCIVYLFIMCTIYFMFFTLYLFLLQKKFKKNPKKFSRVGIFFTKRSHFDSIFFVIRSFVWKIRNNRKITLFLQIFLCKLCVYNFNLYIQYILYTVTYVCCNACIICVFVMVRIYMHAQHTYQVKYIYMHYIYIHSNVYVCVYVWWFYIVCVLYIVLFIRKLLQPETVCFTYSKKGLFNGIF
eukprot:TRINITY_DN6800_c0_g1_i2.p2 TRINITY_DN6800_c0_g1~~TRINITY_DN6800_c0_g1_i2.p2  ORF type:complete len:205 (+),score=-23.55 TRINITY_DN6800_c0_g1_i2:496-1110(+)